MDRACGPDCTAYITALGTEKCRILSVFTVVSKSFRQSGPSTAPAPKVKT